MASSSAATAAGASQGNRRKFTQEANSHGPYLWSGEDIENALLWFTQSTQKQQRQQQLQVEDGGNETMAEEGTADLLTENEQSSASSSAAAAVAVECQEEEAGCEFLRLLLHSRGIWNPRPSKLKKKRSATSSAATNHLADDGHVNKRKRKRKRYNDDDSTNVGGGNINENDGEEGSKRPASSTMELSSPLQSVLMGYYQLFHKENVVTMPLEDGNNNNSNDSGSIDKDKDTATASATSEATLRASSKLYDDLNTIILSRQHTQDIYRASLYTTSAPSNHLSSLSTIIHQQEHPTIQKSDHRNQHRLSFQMTHKIDQYMVHPTTCARRVYASSIYDRLLHLAGTANNNNNNSNETETEEVATTSSKRVQKFLQKLFGLAMTTSSVNHHNDGKIQEVILLLFFVACLTYAHPQMWYDGSVPGSAVMFQMVCSMML
jgi:hypothetical protein